MPRALLLLLLPAALAVADHVVLPAFSIPHRTFTVVTENDKYFAGTDQHYTNGIKLTWLGETNLNQSHEFIQTAAKFIPWMDPENVNWRYKAGCAFGQNIYTPTDIDTTTLVPGDRPYAAWLYGSIILQAQKDDQLRVVELSLGMVGPAALGEEVQNSWHDVINVPHAEGWRHQLRNEPGLRLSWERRYRKWAWQAPTTLFGFDTVLRHRITVGNVLTYAAGGAVVRIGWRLPSDFGPDLIRPGGDNTTNDGGPQRFGAYVYASGEARLVARDIFLDGNTWHDSHSVDKRPVVGDLSLGFVLHWPRFRFAYTQDYRTKEFYGQPQRDVFGSIGISFIH